MTITVRERKAKKVQELKNSVAAAVRDLHTYASEHGGKFILFGSAATGRLKYDSDFDLIVDFVSPKDRPAYAEAERICWAHGLSPDVHYLAEVSDRLLARTADERIDLG